MAIALTDYEIYKLESLPLAIYKLLTVDADQATIHHAAYSMERTKDPDEIIRLLHQWHYVEHKWKNGIGYHGIIIPDGRFLLTYRGLRGLTGAHAKGHNSNNLGFLVWGDFNHEHLTEEQENTVIALRALLKTIGKIDKFWLHRQLNHTSCPGDNFDEDLWIL